MHIDYLNITVPDPHNDTVRPKVQEIINLCGGVLSPASTGQKQLFRIGTTGTVRIEEKSLGYFLYGFSGNALEVLRSKGLINDYLWIYVDHPHSVTSLDIAHDVRVKSPRLLTALWKQAHSEEGIQLTRKRIGKKSISRWSVIGLDGDKTGTLYLGSRKAEVRLKVYDKRQQVFDRTGEDIGPLTRYELTVTSKMGISLADASDPTRLFWHFMDKVITPPKNIFPWEPGGEGFKLPPQVKLLAAEKLRRRVEASQDLKDWFVLADSMGPNGMAYLQTLFDRAKLDALTTAPLVTTQAPQKLTKGS